MVEGVWCLVCRASIMLIMLVLGVAATALAVSVAFKGADYADDHGWPLGWVIFFGFLALAFWLAAHLIPTGPPI